MAGEGGGSGTLGLPRGRRTWARRGRLGVASGNDGDAAVGRDLHREFGIDEIDATRTEIAAEQPALELHLGARRAGDDLIAGAAHDEVAHAQERVARTVGLEPGLADFDVVPGPELLLNRPRDPGTGHAGRKRAAEDKAGEQRKGDDDDAGGCGDARGTVTGDISSDLGEKSGHGYAMGGRLPHRIVVMAVGAARVH